MVTLSTPAQIAIHSLLPTDRVLVERLIGQLEQDSSLAGYAVDLLADATRLVRATTLLLLAFRVTGPDCEVLDVFTQERLQLFVSRSYVTAM